MIKLPLVDRIKFQLERQFVKGAGYQLLFVALMIGTISVIGGAALRLSGADGSWSEWIWWAFLRLTDPGYLGDDEGTWRRTVSTILTVSGYVIFLGSLVAILTQWLIARMREFERGLTPVSLVNHVVIIGWTNRTIPLLRELLGTEHAERRFLAAFETRRLRPVILSEDVSAIRAQELRGDPVIGRQAGRIILRYGTPLDEGSIQRAGCLNAAAVIMPSDFGPSTELVTPDIETIRALLSIDARAAEHGHRPPLVIAEIQDERRMEMVTRAYRGPLEVVPSDTTVSRLLAQNLLHPGLSSFFREALTAGEGNDFFLRIGGTLAGSTLARAGTRFPRALLMGVLRQEGEHLVPMLNAPPSLTILQDDRLVLLARSLEDARPVGADRTDPLASTPKTEASPPRHAPADDRTSADAATPQAPPQEHRILVLGWSQRVPNLLQELSRYHAHRFEIDMISTAGADFRTREIERYSPEAASVPVRHIETDYLLTGELDRLDLERYTAIYLLTSDRLDNIEEADARAIVAHRVIDGLLGDREPRPQILLELGDAENEGLIRSPDVETLISPMIISHVMAQVALRRETRLIFEELFTAGGAEVEFFDPARYGVAERRSFAEVARLVAERGDTLLGFRRYRPGLQAELVLNPPRDRTIQPDADDRLCVLTTVS